MYIVIHPDGSLEAVNKPATMAAIRKEVGPPGFDMVNFDPTQRMYAFVNDEGILSGMEPNPMGSLTLSALGRCSHLLAGPIVITGWKYPSAGLEIRDLTGEQVELITDALAHVMALAGPGVTA
jgi:hypothetical protein